MIFFQIPRNASGMIVISSEIPSGTPSEMLVEMLRQISIEFDPENPRTFQRYYVQ